MSNAVYHPFRARLDAEVARSIRARVRAGAVPRALAQEFGVALSTVYDVIAERTYPPRLVVDSDDATLDALAVLAARAGQSLEGFVSSSLRALASSAKTP